MVRLWLLLSVVLAALGCAGRINTTPPREREIERSKVFNKPYDHVWARAVDWFASHNVIIEKIEKESGLITAKYQLQMSNDQLDPGSITASGAGAEEPSIKLFASLNMVVRSEGAESTKVSVNLFGNYEATTYWGWLERHGPVTATGNCVSTGNLERKVFEYIGNR